MAQIFLGYVVQFANDARYKGLDAYLQVNLAADTATLSHNLEGASIFIDKKEAKLWADKYATLKTESHSLPEVRPVWHEIKLTLTDPNPRQLIIDALKEAKEATQQQRPFKC